jgi:hypothetical protein
MVDIEFVDGPIIINRKSGTGEECVWGQEQKDEGDRERDGRGNTDDPFVSPEERREWRNERRSDDQSDREGDRRVVVA